MPNEAKRPARKTMKLLEAAVDAARDEGFNVWGFIFKDMGKDGAVVDIFTNQPDPIPVFIVKTKAALQVMMERMPDEFNLAEQEKAVAEYLSGKIDPKRLTQIN